MTKGILMKASNKNEMLEAVCKWYRHRNATKSMEKWLMLIVSVECTFNFSIQLFILFQWWKKKRLRKKGNNSQLCPITITQTVCTTPPHSNLTVANIAQSHDYVSDKWQTSSYPIEKCTIIFSGGDGLGSSAIVDCHCDDIGPDKGYTPGK